MSTARFTVTLHLELSDELALRTWVESMVSPMYLRTLVEPDGPAPGLVLCAVRAINVPGTRIVAGTVRRPGAPGLDLDGPAIEISPHPEE